LTFPRFPTVISNQSTLGQLLPIPRLQPLVFEPMRPVRMSTIYYNKYVDNHPLLLLPCPMFRSPSASTSFRSSLDRPLLDSLSVNSASSVLKSDVDPNSVVSSGAQIQPNPFRIRSYEKRGRGAALSARLCELCASALSFLFAFLCSPVSGHGSRRLPACVNPAIPCTIRVLNPISKEGARCDD
jgi:hypothetical protein